ncbi:MAG: hypothetical protein JRJ59_09735, partial [Deltaproteobacteria bacterium]|nr:hypothetical protein [Deltaproteobacteria bacterium]
MLEPGRRLHFHGRPAQSLISPPKGGDESILSPLIKAVRALNAKGLKPWIVCRTRGQMKRLTELLAGHGLIAAQAAGPPGSAPDRDQDHLSLALGPLSAGFFLPGLNLALLTEEEALGQTRVRPGPRPAPPLAARLASYTELNPGDLVVHTDHGIGRFVSLINLAVEGRMGD